MFYWVMKHVLFGPVIRLAFRPWTRGLENVPTTGGAILASNHLAVIDSFVLPIVLNRKVQFLGKSDYFTGTGIKGRTVAGFMRGVGTIPVDRSGGKASEAALRTGRDVLRRGELLGLYPEGTRSKDGRLARGKTGVAWLALTADCPVVPVAVAGTDKVQPVGASWPRPHRISIVFGEPLTFPEQRSQAGRNQARRVVTDRIMEAIAELSGQEKAGW